MPSLGEFFEDLFYAPRWYHRAVSLFLLPLSMIYATLMLIRRKISSQKRYPVPIISIGNLVVGGTGKTPFVIALANQLSDRRVAIVSRGYGRNSRGLVEVSRDGEILCGADEGGDEALLMALRSHASVIVSEDRASAIELAISRGVELILLDDGFNRVEIAKYEIVLEPISRVNILPLPSGPYREFGFCAKVADMVLREGEDYEREVSFEDLTPKMILITAIANPKRLDRYLPAGVVAKEYLPDHAYFDKKELKKMLKQSGASSILVTEKDWVKLRESGLPLSLMKLELRLKDSIMAGIKRYLRASRMEEDK